VILYTVLAVRAPPLQHSVAVFLCRGGACVGAGGKREGGGGNRVERNNNQPAAPFLSQAAQAAKHSSNDKPETCGAPELVQRVSG
jgi:hypothetical protein